MIGFELLEHERIVVGNAVEEELGGSSVGIARESKFWSKGTIVPSPLMGAILAVSALQGQDNSAKGFS